jgi:hypothetical protein
MSEMNLFIPIKKVDVAQRLVYGTLAAEMPDQSGEIMDYETAKPAFQKWSDDVSKATEGRSVGNVRAMHTAVSAGKLTDISFDDVTKSIMGVAKIVDDNEWQKVLEGVYTGFSLGGSYAKRWACPANASLKRYTPTIAEVSIVDNPCIPSARFEVIKADGSTELRKFQVTKDAEADLKQVWLAKDGTTYDKKADALQKNVDLAAAIVPDAVANAIEALQKAQAALATKEPQTDEPVEKAADEPVVNQPQEPVVEKSIEAEPAKNAEGEIVTQADTAAAVKSASDNLQKGLYDISAVVDVITSLSWLQDDMAWSALFNESNASLAADAKRILGELCGFLTSVVADATAALTADKASGLTGAHVAAIRKFTGNDDLLKDFVEAEVKNEPLEKLRAESAEQIEKINHDLELEKAAKATLEKAVGTLTAGIEDMTKRMEKLEAQPAPAKGHKSVTVIKGHEGTTSGVEDTPDEVLIQKFAHLPPEQARAKFQEAKKAAVGQ